MSNENEMKHITPSKEFVCVKHLVQNIGKLFVQITTDYHRAHKRKELVHTMAQNRTGGRKEVHMKSASQPELRSTCDTPYQGLFR